MQVERFGLQIGGKSRHPRYGRPQDILAEPLLAITSHPPGPVTTPPGSWATGGGNHAEPGWPKPRLSGSEDSNGGAVRGECGESVESSCSRGRSA
jgi:hypothetical protein